MFAQVDSVMLDDEDWDIEDEDAEVGFNEEEEAPVVVFGLHLPEVQLTSQEAAVKHMVRFFANKEMHCGGKICQKQLLSSRHISIVALTGLEGGVEYAYQLMEDAGLFTVSKKDLNGIAPDVALVIRVLNDCARMGVPKEFSTGMMLLYLKFCEGIMF